jgi:hypothetical protein
MVKGRTSIALAFLLVAACSDPSPPKDASFSSPVTGTDVTEDPGSAQDIVTDDDRFAALGKRFPGFAGVAVDRSKGQLIIYTSEQIADVPALKRALIRDFGDDLRGLEPRLVLQTWSFRQLKRWYDDLNPGDVDGLVFTDINEVTNTIDIAVDDVDRYASEIYEAARDQGIPEGVVRVIHQEPFVVDED